MNDFCVNITDTAFKDLNDIAKYIKDELKQPEIALKLVGRIRDAIFSLGKSPARHACVADGVLAQQGYRSMPIDNYIIFYVVSEVGKVVDVSRVLYAKRNWEKLLR